MHRVRRVGPQRKVEGWHTNLLNEVQAQTAMTEERVDREGRAASSGMRGEKYRDEVELERSEGTTTDLLDELAGAKDPIQEGNQLEERW